MSTVEIEQTTLEAIKTLMRLIRNLDNYYPGVPLVQAQANAVDDMLENNAQAQTS